MTVNRETLRQRILAASRKHAEDAPPSREQIRRRQLEEERADRERARQEREERADGQQEHTVVRDSFGTPTRACGHP